MDPYLETRWSDVHVTLIGFIKEVLQPLLPPGLRARSEERVLLETSDPTPQKSYRSDVSVVDSGPREGGSVRAPRPTVATVEPYLVGYHEGPEFDRFIQILDSTSGNRVVTAIEVLSPWNKGPGRLNKDYLRKLDDYARGGVSIVEIDLLRYPPRDRLQVGQVDLPLERRAPYLVCVRRAWAPDVWEVYPMVLRKPLPRVPIPLRQTDADVGLELQPLIDRVYTAGAHDDIDYSKPVDTPLDKDDAAWADDLMRKAGKR
jgi:uncharacterized protein DUF4058